MTDKDLQTILRDIATFQAEYKPQPASSKPAGCAIPPMTGAELQLDPLNDPGIIKPCNPIFNEFPVVPEPFSIPESCPAGISFNPKAVTIYASLDDTRPAGSVTVGIEKNADDLCSYDLNLPDIVIPCFPGGPQLFSNASITVVDLNKDTTDTTSLSLTKDENMACRWILEGSTTITIPKVPCPSGINFSSGNLQLTSTCSRTIENKPISIARSQNNPCTYDINFPAIKIPCYPEGPKMSSDLVIKVRDSGVVSKPVTELPVSLGALPGKCCDFHLGGDVVIDVPCQDGVKFVEKPWVIKQAIWYDKDGKNITPTIEIPPIPVSASKQQDICHLGIDLPPTVIPCYPDGIRFIGAVKFKTSDNVTLTDTIDLSNDGKARDRSKPCQWDLTETDIEIPTPYCPGGFTWGSDIVIKANSGTVLKKLGPDDQPTSYARYHTLGLNNQPPGPGPKDCGAKLTGEINLGLPDFVVSCSKFSVGDKNSVSIYLNDKEHKTSPYVVGLVPTQCGFEFNNTTLDLPVLSCPSGFNSEPSTFEVYLGSSKTPLDHTVQLTPKNALHPECGLTLSGTLRLPMSGGGGGGITSRPWNPNEGYDPGDTTAIVFPEGGRCLYTGIGNTSIPTLNMPGTPSGDTSWECVGCTDEKVFSPYKVIRCTELPAVASGQTFDEKSKKAVVKVVPRSYLFESHKSSATTFIYGLNTPFVLGPQEKVWLEVVYDSSGSQQQVVYAAVCKGTAWDYTIAAPTAGTDVASVDKQQYKTIRAADAQTLSSTNTFQAQSVNSIIGIDDATKADLLQKLTDTINKLAQLRDSRPRQLKAYVLIASAGKGQDVSSKKIKPLSGLVLQQDTTQYNVDQILNSHLVLNSRNADNVLVTIPEKTVGSDPDFTELVAPSLTTTLGSEAGTPPRKTISLSFGSSQVDKYGVNFQIGVNSKAIQVYFTTDGSLPTINTAENKKCFKYEPGDGGQMKIYEDEVSWGITWMAVCSGFEPSEVNYTELITIDPSATPAS